MTMLFLPAKWRTVILQLSLHKHMHIAVRPKFFIYSQRMTVALGQTLYKYVFTFPLELREDWHNEILSLISKIHEAKIVNSHA